MVSDHPLTDRQQRQRELTKEINRIPLRDVMENLFGLRGKKGGANMLKYEVSPGFHLNCSTTENWFASFNGAPIPGLSGAGRKATGGYGAIDAVIAVRSILGGQSDFKQARTELQQSFLPHTLESGYVPAATHDNPRPPPTPEAEVPKPLPQRFNRAEDYRLSAGREDRLRVVRLPENIEDHVIKYLVQERRIAESIALDLLKRNAAYPSVRERRLVSRRTGHPYILAEPAVIFPLTSWREEFPVGYDYKTLPTDPAYASFSATEGRKKFGGYLVGSWNDNTRHVILTEAALDSISKWILDRPGPDTCIWGMSGARSSELLLSECQRRGADVRTAFDNDRAGRLAAAATAQRCAELGIPCEQEFPSPSEIDFEMPEDSNGKHRFSTVKELCSRQGLAFGEGAPAAGLLRATVPNHAAILELLARFCDDDQLDRMTALGVGQTAPSGGPRLRFEIRNKDWNDILKREYVAKLPEHPTAVPNPPAPEIEP